jgi:monoamine oxidase
MTTVTRRSVLCGLAAAVAHPCARAESAGNPDVVVIGAGVAGLAAARALAAAGLRIQIVEARNRIGGRVLTDQDTLGAVWERGCTRLPRAAAGDDLGALANAMKEPLRVDEPALRLHDAGRPRDAAGIASFLSLRARVDRELAEAAGRGLDVAALAVLSRELRASPDFPAVAADFHLQRGVGLERVSALDVAGQDDGRHGLLLARGLSAFVESLAHKLPLRLSTPVRRVRLGGPRARIETENGTIEAAIVVVAVPAAVIAGGGLAFDPPLPEAVLQCCHDLPGGLVDKVGLRFRKTPLAGLAGYLAPHGDNAAAALRVLVPPGVGNFCIAEISGAEAVELEAAGETAQIDFALAALKDLLGSGVAKDLDKGSATRWLADPWSRGSHSYALPGRFPARETLMRPVLGQLLFAGEHTAATRAGTLHGAWRSGGRAAGQALRLLGRGAA